MKKKTALFITLLIATGIIAYNLIYYKEYELSENEMELVNYFNEVALNSEFDDRQQKIIKWTEPMTIFILKDNDREFNKQIAAIKKTIDKINNIVKDEFKIKLTDSLSKINAVIFLIDKDRVGTLFPSFFEGIEEEFSGLVDVEYDLDTYEIKNAKIFIDINETIEVQESTILEELTQSIGLMNDSEKYSNSVFYQNKADSINVMEYSKMDIEIIKMLYHPKMKPGLNYEEVENVLKRILKKK